MISWQPFGDVVKEDGTVQGGARGDAADETARQRMLLFQLAALDRAENADGADQMLVDRIVMVHVELHERDGVTERRHETSEHTRFVHAPKRPFGRTAGGRYLEKQAIGVAILLQCRRYQIERSRDGPQCMRVDVHAFFIGKMED